MNLGLFNGAFSTPSPLRNSKYEMERIWKKSVLIHYTIIFL